uniref:DUF2206 domain-containing protein n=1 Tax=Methanococcus maripaludis (strain C6 / ATCC BAA-1332) TaxID=444158 RepID=A9A6X2_METM6
MKIPNPFKLQNWRYKNFLILILFIQISFLGIFSLNKLGIETPILRAVTGFIYILFVPGYLILRILRVHNISSLESILYSLGTSIFYCMFLGFLSNELYPVLNITKYPISELPLVITFVFSGLLLTLISNSRQSILQIDYYSLKDLFSKKVMFLSILPIVTLFGTYLVNYYGNNLLLMFLILVIVVVVFLTVFTKTFQNLVPYIIWAISFSLVFSTTLIGPYALNYDGEFSGAKEVIDALYYNSEIYGNYNSVLSNKILTPVIYNICGFNLTSIYKIIFPFIISLLPLEIYLISKKYLNSKNAFLSSLICFSFGPFFTDYPFLTKQGTATFFIALSIIIMINNNLKNSQKTFFMTICGISIIWAHYGSSYLFLAALFTILLLKYFGILTKSKKHEMRSFLYFITMYSLILFAWYLNVSGASLFYTVFHIGNNVFLNIFSEFFGESSRGAALFMKKYNGLDLVFKYLNLGVSGFMVLGLILETIKNHFKKKYINYHIGLSIFFTGLLLCSIALPYFAVMGPTRLYILSFPTLCLFGIIGGLKVFNYVNKLKLNIDPSKILCIYLSVMLLLSSGVLHELTGSSYSLSLGQESIKDSHNMAYKLKFYYYKITGYDVELMIWLNRYWNPNSYIFHGVRYGMLGQAFEYYGNFPKENTIYLKSYTAKLYDNSYVPIFYVNNKENFGFQRIEKRAGSDMLNMTDVEHLYKNENIIYCNGMANIRYKYN